MRYQVVLHREPEGYTVSCPALPGCISEGESEQDALENIRVAIEEYLAVIREQTLGSDVREVEVPV